ncbi:MAG: hypothetical protein IJ131_10205 [Eggerthellaceae bacterium]|nr:hypothetical protein [Eggerthellaceae bacterium]
MKASCTLSLVFAGSLAALLVLGGCAGQSEDSKASSADMQAPAQSAPASASSAPATNSSSGSSAASASASSSQPTFRTVGATANAASQFNFANKTGKAIKALAVKPTQDTDFPASILASGDQVANGETVVLACPAVDAPEAGGQTADVKLEARADMQLTLEDGTELVLHQLNLSDIKDAEVRVNGDVAYLDYTSIASGSKVSTLEAEQSISKNQTADAAAGAAATEAAAVATEQAPEDQQAAEEQTAVEQAPAQEVAPVEYADDAPAYYDEIVYDEPAAEEPAYQEPAAAEPAYQEPAADNAAVGGDDEAACIPDIVLR